MAVPRRRRKAADRPLACIPHGDAMLALGTSTTAAGPPAQIAPASVMPTTGALKLAGYTDVYLRIRGIDVHDLNAGLRTALEGLDVVETTTLVVSTNGGGGIVNIPFVYENASTTGFSCTYWIENSEGRHDR